MHADEHLIAPKKPVLAPKLNRDWNRSCSQEDLYVWVTLRQVFYVMFEYFGVTKKKSYDKKKYHLSYPMLCQSGKNNNKINLKTECILYYFKSGHFVFIKIHWAKNNYDKYVPMTGLERPTSSIETDWTATCATATM